MGSEIPASHLPSSSISPCPVGAVSSRAEPTPGPRSTLGPYRFISLQGPAATSTLLHKLQPLGPRSRAEHGQGSSALTQDGFAARATCPPPRDLQHACSLGQPHASSCLRSRASLPSLFAFPRDAGALIPRGEGQELRAGPGPRCSTGQGHWRSAGSRFPPLAAQRRSAPPRGSPTWGKNPPARLGRRG